MGFESRRQSHFSVSKMVPGGRSGEDGEVLTRKIFHEKNSECNTDNVCQRSTSQHETKNVPVTIPKKENTEECEC